MKTYKYILSIVLFVAAIISCNEDEFGSDDFVSTVTAPANLAVLFDVTQDNTGLVTVTPNSEGAVSYSITFGDETADPITVKQGENTQHTYAEGNYEVKIVAAGITGLTAELTQQLVVSFNAPENLNVVIENDEAISKQVNVTTTADFAVSFDVYFGEEGSDDPVSANIGETASYGYAEAGLYTIRVVVKGAAIETTEYIVQDFEVTEIIQPLVSAPTPPNRADADVISIFTTAYADVEGTNYFPDWGQAGQGSSWAMFELDGDEMLNYVTLSYQGISFGETVDVSGMEYLHMDVWTADLPQIKTSLINGVDGNSTEKEIASDLTIDEWTSIDIPISEYVDLGLSVDQIFQLKFVGEPWAAGSVFIDNIYFYKSSGEPFDDGLLTNGDFESGAAPWFIGTSPDLAHVVPDAGNTYYSINVPAAGNPWDVNVSQKVEIIEGETYTLIFDAWSDTNRPILAGIGLSAGPWTNDNEEVNITTTRQTYSISVNSIDAPFGAPDARVLFDLGAAAGSVNIDNVALFLGDGPTAPFNGGLVTNGDFESGAEPWLIGTGPDSAPVVTDGDNTYYSVNVPAAGNPWDVNVSQKLEIIEGSTYTLTFDAWSDTNRPILAGIGLSAGPWTNDNEEVNITTTRETYTITVNSIDAPFGAPDARVLFDLGAAAGSVNIDNVSLFLN